jgi:hypothetical protein
MTLSSLHIQEEEEEEDASSIHQSCQRTMNEVRKKSK